MQNGSFLGQTHTSVSMHFVCMSLLALSLRLSFLSSLSLCLSLQLLISLSQPLPVTVSLMHTHTQLSHSLSQIHPTLIPSDSRFMLSTRQAQYMRILVAASGLGLLPVSLSLQRKSAWNTGKLPSLYTKVQISGPTLPVGSPMVFSERIILL